MTPVRGAAIVVACFVFVAVGCGDDTTSAPTTTSSPTSTVTETSTTTAIASETTFGWLSSFEGRNGTTILGVDQAEMLTGQEARDAAREDGVIGENEDLPNDYYIRNPDEATTELVVSPDVVVTLQACYEGGECVTTEQVDLDTWSVLLGSEDDPGLGWNWYGAGSLPYVFTIEDDIVVQVDEVYLP
jgi:hypothetical protein